MPIISVIIVTYNNLNLVIDCLNSINKFNDIGEDLEIIIIDNSPNNEIFKYVSLNHPNVKIKQNDNKGFGEANNVGVKISQSEYLVFLNPDTILIEPIFKFALNIFENQKNVGIFGFQLINKSGDKNWSFFFIDKYGLKYSILIKFFNKYGIYLYKQMFTSGANIFIKKKIFKQAGGFDENIFMYLEEPDLFKRVMKLNYITKFYKEKKIIHLEGSGNNQDLNSFKRRLDSAKYYCEKYMLNFEKQIKAEIKIINLKILLYSITQKNSISYLLEMKNILYSYLHKKN